MAYKKELAGQRFGRLTVIEDTGERRRERVLWLCKCDCGNYTQVYSSKLSNGATRSCGCLRTKVAGQLATSRSDRKEATCLGSLGMKITKRNTSGVKGVSWHKQSKKWLASITFQGEFHYLGCFLAKQDAIDARKKAEEKYFKPMLEKYGRGQNE